MLGIVYLFLCHWSVIDQISLILHNIVSAFGFHQNMIAVTLCFSYRTRRYQGRTKMEAKALLLIFHSTQWCCFTLLEEKVTTSIIYL